MSLRVWLPLTKDLRQQGLSNTKVENHNATLNTAGKLGSCYYFNGSQQWLQFDTVLGDYYNNDWSIACWLKPTDSTRSVIISEYSSTGASNVGLELTASRVVRLYWNGSPDINFTTAGALPINEWTHLTVTKQARIVKVYFNGELKQTYTNSSDFSTRTSASYPRIGDDYRGNSANTVSYQGYINDFRMYDHCLSPMEVKELAKGLVLHYPLNRQGWGQNNILLNTGFESRYTQSTGWDTTKNGTQLANSWGGYNRGVNNQATVYHAHLKEFNGEWVYEYIRTANESWLGISQDSLQSKLTAGKTYTFSWEEYHVDGINRVGTGLYYFKAGATSANFHLGIQQASDVIRETEKWQKYTYTFVAPSDADWSKNMSWYIYGDHNGNGTFYMRHPKLEEGSIATPWCPNSSDALAITMGLNSTIEYDCSGFCNNGTRTGTFTWTSNTPKYVVSQVFNGTDNAIQTPSLPTMITDKNYTVAVWIYKTVIGSKNYQTIYGGPSGFEIEARNGSTNETKFVLWNWGKPMASYELNEWNHCVFVHSDSDCKIYLNGEYIATGTAKASNPAGNYFIGAWNTATQQNFDGLMSDFRIYATALSADDVKSLYQNCATIDPDGTIRGQIRN